MFKPLYISLNTQHAHTLLSHLLTEHPDVPLHTLIRPYKETWQYLTSHAQDYAVIVDLTNACEEGLQLCKDLRDISDVPLLLFGGSRDFYSAQQAIALNVIDYLTYPLDPAALKNALITMKTQMKNRQTSEFHSHFSHRFLSSSSSGSIIDQTKEVVETSLNEPITLKSIAERMHYNPSYLGQKFKAHENKTFNQYLLERRMKRAQYLLTFTDMKIYEIANEVGYNDLDWFYKKFRDYTGTCASSFRSMTTVSHQEAVLN